MVITITAVGTITTADGEVIEVDEVFTYSGDANVNEVIRAIIAWIQSILEG